MNCPSVPGTNDTAKTKPRKKIGSREKQKHIPGAR